MFTKIVEIIYRILALIGWGRDAKMKQDVRDEDLKTVKDTADKHRDIMSSADGESVRDDEPNLFRD